ncbi:MAG: hypothetical protein BroJett018_29480 [Chloroflexota bacterium]|nr:MAG: hypothetical protein BroJett018_29480 [Chloroflexota bacterium]
MGCDIHLYVERRVNGVWESADVWRPVHYYPHPVEVDFEDSYYEARNYFLFAALANVRNRYGLEPIAEPRGVPPDVSQPIRERLSREYDFDWDHSHSWFTLAELLVYDWTKPVPLKGYLTALDFARWKWEINSSNFDISQPIQYNLLEIRDLQSEGKITICDADQMIELLTSINPSFPQWKNRRSMGSLIGTHYPKHYVDCEWQQPLYTLVGEFWSETMPRLLRLGKPEDVRIVFWFDN